MIFEPGETVQNIFLLIITFGAAQGLFLFFLFLARSAGRKREDRRPEALLAVLMLTFAANIIHAAFIRPGMFAQGIIHTALEPFQLLFGPLVYEYVRSLVQPERRERLWPGAILQAAVFLAITAFFSVAGVLTTDPHVQKFFDGFAWVITLTYLFFYILKTLKMVHAHQKFVRDEFTNTKEVDLSWVRGFIIAFLIVEFFWVLLFVWIIHFDQSPHFKYANALLSSIIVYTLGFRALLQKPAVKLPEERSGVQNQPMSPLKYERSSLGERDLASLKSRLVDIMEKKKPWLDSELNVQDLADFCDMSRHTLTEVLNRSCGMNFCDFVNRYRVNEFKRLAVLPDSEKFNLLGLALDSGFNSKATFNSSFRKATGMTPSAWRISANRV